MLAGAATDQASCSPRCQLAHSRGLGIGRAQPPAAAAAARRLQGTSVPRTLLFVSHSSQHPARLRTPQASAVEQPAALGSNDPAGDQPLSSSSSSQDVATRHTNGAAARNGAQPPSGVAPAAVTLAQRQPAQHQQEHQRPRGAGVKVKGMVKHFHTKDGLYKAVDGVDTSIEPNQLVALLGPSGSGKTTLLRMIAGLEEPTAGQLFIDGVDATRMSVKDRNIGFVFQSYALFRHMTVAENIAFGPRVRKLGIDTDKRVQELLELVELPGLGDRYPPQLSGGQRQRIALARALASNPRILLLDEPFGALDPLVRVSLRRSLRDIVNRVGVTTIMVTHDQEEAFDIADRVVIFNKGRVEQQGETQDVTRRPSTPFAMNFIGEVNSVPSNCQLTKRMNFDTEYPAVMFRPENVEVFTEIPPGDKHVCPATIMDKRHIGWVVKYFLKCDDGVKLEMHVEREDDDQLYADLDTLQRVFLKVRPLHFMGYHPKDIDRQPLDLV